MGDENGNNTFSGGDQIDDRPVFPSPGNPMRTARQLLADFKHDDGDLTLRHWHGGWWRWERTRWAEVEPAVLGLYQRLEKAIWWNPKADKGEGAWEGWLPNRRKIGDLKDALATITHLPEDTDCPSWLTEKTVPASEIVSCRNGLLHVATRTLGGHTPAFFNRVSVPFDYDPDVPEPARWLEFLNDIWPNDPDSIAALQEWFGYILSGHTDLHKVLLLVGPTRSGKGTIARVLQALLGGDSVGPTLASLASNFGLQPLIGKPLAIVSDARLTKATSEQAVEQLLRISGEDIITIDRKYAEPWSGKLPTRFAILSNEIPNFHDAAGAISNRMIVLSMSKSFLGRENPALTRELLAELPAIFGWALQGFDRLHKNGEFTVPEASRSAIDILRDTVSPTAAFVRDECVTGAEQIVDKDTLFSAWKRWAEENGHQAGSKVTFARNLLAAVPGVSSTRPRSEGRARQYAGIRLRDDLQPTMANTPDHPDHPAQEAASGPSGPGGPGKSPLSALHTTDCPDCGRSWGREPSRQCSVPDQHEGVA